MKPRLFIFTGIVLILLIGCGGYDTETEPAPPDNQSVILKTENYQWMAGFTLVDRNENSYPAEAVLVIHNRVDRNVTVDFDGPIHKTVSLGDNARKTINLSPGTYKIMASSPGLPYVPSDYGQTLEAYTKYSLVFTKKKLKTNYNK